MSEVETQCQTDPFAALNEASVRFDVYLTDTHERYICKKPSDHGKMLDEAETTGRKAHGESPLDLNDEDKIRSFIINNLKWPTEKANVLAPEWAKARDFQGDVEKRSAKPVLALPERPIREIRNRENVVEYLRSPEGFGPWAEAGALTRPLLRSISPKAYQSLVNWLRNNELPADLPIPTKSQTTDRDALGMAQGASDALRAAKALYERERYAARKRN